VAAVLRGKVMEMNEEEIARNFFQASEFSTRGAVITDLDGTAVHENNRMTIIHHEVELGLKKIYDLGRPVIINTLRFPLSVIRTFAADWYKISSKPIPVIVLNGSQLGFIVKQDDQFVFEQVKAFPLVAVEIREVCKAIDSLQKDGISSLILFFYAEDWTTGEVIWTPDPTNIPHLQDKYRSASSVISTSIEQLETILLAQPICMILLLVDAEADQLMAYQHTKRSNFITHHGVDKMSGTKEMADYLAISLHDSVCAGDSAMDNFLSAGGLAVHVHNTALPFNGTVHTLRLKDYHAYGQLLSKLASMQKKELTHE
jgi:hydroxymethylpyrimidine pyrophosphatase-like HAD family hydrolase